MWTTIGLIAGFILGGVALLVIGILLRIVAIKIAGKYWANYVRGGATVTNIPWPDQKTRHPAGEKGDGPAP